MIKNIIIFEISCTAWQPFLLQHEFQCEYAVRRRRQGDRPPKNGPHAIPSGGLLLNSSREYSPHFRLDLPSVSPVSSFPNASIPSSPVSMPVVGAGIEAQVLSLPVLVNILRKSFSRALPSRA